MLEIHDQIQQAVTAIRQAWDTAPHAGVILGTGLGSLTDQMEVEATLDYEEIPHFPSSTATSHRGRLVCGRLGGVPILAMEGRFHQYEGYSLKQITLPVRVMQALGARLMIVSQAVGGMNPNYALGDLMIIDDQINLMGDNPLVGVNDDRLGPRFPDMSAPYDRELIEVGLGIARKEDFVAHKGVMVAVTGPCLETRAEYRFLRMIGADVVGMSTVPEVIVAVHCGLRTFGVSIVTDMCLPDALEEAERRQDHRHRQRRGAEAHQAGPGHPGTRRGVEPMNPTNACQQAVEAIRALGASRHAGPSSSARASAPWPTRSRSRPSSPTRTCPHFPRSTAIGHAGRLLLGRLNGQSVAVMQGRFHLYEGWTPQQTALPVRVLRALGAESLLVTNAAGGLHPAMRVGDPMVIDDHINLMFRNPLVGSNDDGVGPRFPDMSRPYDREYGERALAAARHGDFACHRGVYAGMLGPTYETRAEYRLLRRLGADAAGMSTVPEVIAAVHAGMRVLGVSTITNVCSPDKLGQTSGQEVIDAASGASAKLLAIARAVIRS